MRRVPIWQRGAVYYFTAPDGRRVSLGTKDRKEALKRYREQGARAAADERPEKKRAARPHAEPPPPPPPVPPPPPPPDPPPPPPPSASTGAGGGPNEPTIAAPAGDRPGGGSGQPDPLQQVGATAAEDPAADEGGDEAIPLSQEEVEAAAGEMAELIVQTIASVTSAVALSRHGRVGVVRQATYQRNIDNWKVLTRRWAAEWHMGPWTAITLSTLALARQQWTCEAGVAARVDETTGEVKVEGQS